MITSTDKQTAREAIEDSGYPLEEVEENLLAGIADSLCDPATVSVLNWYLEDLCRVEYIGQAATIFGDDGFQILAGGQYLYWQEILRGVLQEMQEEAVAEQTEEEALSAMGKAGVEIAVDAEGNIVE